MSDEYRIKRRTVWTQRNLLGIYQLKWVVPSTHPVWRIERPYVLNRYVTAIFSNGIMYRGQVVRPAGDHKNYVVRWDNGDTQSLLPVHILKIWDERNTSAY